MKSISNLICTLVFVFLFASCQKENQPEICKQQVTVTATIESITKVSYTEDEIGLKQSWVVGDNIVGFTEDNEKIELTIPDEAHIQGGVASFTVVHGSIPQTNGKKVYLIYAPGKHYGDVGTSKNMTVDISSQGETSIPALMMATGVVNNGNISLTFSNEMSIICMKNPTIAASKGTELTKMSLNAANVYTKAEFSVDGSGNMIMTPSVLGDITKACKFTPDATNGTTTNTNIYFAVLPNTNLADLSFFTASNNAVTISAKTLDAGKYYYFTPTFPVNSKCIILKDNDLNFSLSQNSNVTVKGIKIESGNKCTYSYSGDTHSGSFSGQNGSNSFQFSLTTSTFLISKIEIICSNFDNTSKNSWTENTTQTLEDGQKLLQWPTTTAAPATQVVYAKSINNVTQIKVSYEVN